MSENIDFAGVIKAIGTMTRPELDAVFNAYKMRAKSVRAETGLVNAATFTPGTRVETVGLSPKYLSGLHGVIVAGTAPRPGDLFVKIDEDDRYFATGRRRFNLDRLAVPASALKREGE